MRGARLADLSAFVHDSTVAPGLDCPQTRSRSGEVADDDFVCGTHWVALALTLVVSVAAGTRDSRRRGHGWSGRESSFSPRSRSRRRLANVAARRTRRSCCPQTKRFAGDWSLAGAEAALDRALADRDVDVVLTIGILTSQQAARRKSLPKPVIAPLVIDPVLQGFPLVEGRSARHNFAYVADFHSVANEVRAFHEIVGFKYMVALVDDALLAALPALTTKAPELAAALNVRIGIVRAGDDVNALLASIPAGVDAVYVTPLRFSDAQLRELAQRARRRANYPRSPWSGAARSKPDCS